jgi:hypothetical protein
MDAMKPNADDPMPAAGHVAGQDDAVTRRINDTIDDIGAGRVMQPSRDAVRKALDTADMPRTGRLPDGTHRAPEGLGRALR